MWKVLSPFLEEFRFSEVRVARDSWPVSKPRGCSHPTCAQSAASSLRFSMAKLGLLYLLKRSSEYDVILTESLARLVSSLTAVEIRTVLRCQELVLSQSTNEETSALADATTPGSQFLDDYRQAIKHGATGMFISLASNGWF